MGRPAIVLVDDEKTILDCLLEQVERMFGRDYIVEVAESAEEAWEVIEAFEAAGVDVAAVVSDWWMPGTRGDEFLFAVRDRRPRAGRVLLTGQADQAALERVRTQGGAHGVVAKPWSPERLRDVLTCAMAA